MNHPISSVVIVFSWIGGFPFVFPQHPLLLVLALNRCAICNLPCLKVILNHERMRFDVYGFLQSVHSLFEPYYLFLFAIVWSRSWNALILNFMAAAGVLRMSLWLDFFSGISHLKLLACFPTCTIFILLCSSSASRITAHIRSLSSFFVQELKLSLW